MSHERSTPSPGSEDFASSPSSSPSSSSPRSFSSASSFIPEQHHVGLTAMERFVLGRSDSTFHAMAGAIGGFTSGVVTCPLDVIKTKLQAQGGFRATAAAAAASGSTTAPSPTHPVYRGMLGTAKIIWSEEGLRGMYRGLGPIILGYLPTWAVWFTVYGESKEVFGKHFGTVQESSFIGDVAG